MDPWRLDKEPPSSPWWLELAKINFHEKVARIMDIGVKEKGMVEKKSPSFGELWEFEYAFTCELWVRRDNHLAHWC
jgi:hypothetical protein